MFLLKYVLIFYFQFLILNIERNLNIEFCGFVVSDSFGKTQNKMYEKIRSC